MYWRGHLGLALLITGGVSIIFRLPLAWLFWMCLIGVLFARIPDWGFMWGGHRGVTHSITFTLIVSILGGVPLLFTLNYMTGFLPEFSLSSFEVLVISFTPIAGGLASHLLGDVITWTGIPLFWPRDKMYALKLCRAHSPRANQALLAIGFAVLITAVWLTTGTDLVL